MRKRVLLRADVDAVVAFFGYDLVRYQDGVATYRSTTSPTLLLSFDIGGGIEEWLLCDAAEDQGVDMNVLYAALDQV